MRHVHPKPTLAQKKKLHADLKLLHGRHWRPAMKPIYDKRGFASIMINRFDPSFSSLITQYPAIYWIELHVDLGNQPEAIRQMIPGLLEGSSKHLEYFELSNTLDVDKSTEIMRDVLPKDARPFGRLPSIQQVVFARVNLNDRIVKELCKNHGIESFDIREAEITKRTVKHFAACPNLRWLDIARSPHFEPAYQQELRNRLPSVEFIHLT